MTSEQIAGAHAYFAESSVARWLKELADQNKIIRRMFGKGYDRIYWYTMPEYMSKNSPHYPHEIQGEDTSETPNLLISHNEKLKSHNKKLKSHNKKSSRYLNKDSLNNTNTNNTNDEILDEILDDLENESSFAQNLKNQIDDVMEQSTADTIDACKKRAVDLLPEHWIKKTFSWKGVREKVEIFDVVDAFLLNIIAQESDARERNMYYVNLRYDKLTAKLNNWVARYANQRTTDRARAVKFEKKPLLSPAEQHRANNPEAFVNEEASDEFAYIENL
jgi:hypothetical protein